MPKTFKDNYCQMNHDFLEDVPHVNNVGEDRKDRSNSFVIAVYTYLAL